MNTLAELATLLAQLAWLYLQLFALRTETLAIHVARWAATNPDEAIATACGLVGAVLLATKGRWAGLGWLAFLGSNAAWIWFAHRNGHPGLLLQQAGFTITSLIGLWVWVIKPRLASTESTT